MKKKNWWELTPKERKEMRDRSARIFYAFDGIEDRGCKTNKGETAIEETIFQVAKKEFDNLVKKIEADEPEDLILDFFKPVCFSAFAIGYIMGQIFDLPNSTLLEDVKALTNKLKERRCFAYLPRERKSQAILTK